MHRAPKPPRSRWVAASLVAAAAGGFAWGWWSPAPPADAPGPQPTLSAPRAAGTGLLAAAAGPRTAEAATPLPPAEPMAWEAGTTPVLARFGKHRPPAAVRQLADWVLTTGDAGGRAVVLVDKQAGRVWLLDPAGRLVGSTAALVGAAVGDDATAGIGDKPLAQILPHEKTTPAGRYLAEAGHNAAGEDVVWVSWDLAVSMHRVRPSNPAERRLQRLASPGSEDNRISFGCINLPPSFYERVLRPAVLRTGAMVYVLPETRSLHAQFGAWDVRAAALLAGWEPPAAHGRVK